MINPIGAELFVEARQAEILEFARLERLAKEATRLRREQEGARPNFWRRWASSLADVMIGFGYRLKTRQKPIL